MSSLFPPPTLAWVPLVDTLHRPASRPGVVPRASWTVEHLGPDPPSGPFSIPSIDFNLLSKHWHVEKLSVKAPDQETFSADTDMAPEYKEDSAVETETESEASDDEAMEDD